VDLSTIINLLYDNIINGNLSELNGGSYVKGMVRFFSCYKFLCKNFNKWLLSKDFDDCLSHVLIFELINSLSVVAFKVLSLLLYTMFKHQNCWVMIVLDFFL